jgi:zinc/manganese transport system substrate-binding protein
MKLKFSYFLLLWFFVTSSFANTAPVPVVASFSVLADVVKQIGGNKITVTSLVGNNQDVHEYELKPSDMVKIAQSRLLFVNGLGLEAGFIDRIVASSDKKLVVASSGITPLTANFDEQVRLDPHIWSDPNNVINYYVPNILAGLVKAMPEDKNYFTYRAKEYTVKLQALNQWINNELARVAIKDRQAVTTHDAFNYLARRYNIKFLFAQGVSTDSEAKPRDIARLEEIIRGSEVKLVFLENMTNNSLIKQLSKDTGATIGGQLYADSLSADNPQASNYIGMVKSNINTLLIAWRGSAR